METCTEREQAILGVTTHGGSWSLLSLLLLSQMALFIWSAPCQKGDPPDLHVYHSFDPLWGQVRYTAGTQCSPRLCVLMQVLQSGRV